MRQKGDTKKQNNLQGAGVGWEGRLKIVDQCSKPMMRMCVFPHNAGEDRGKCKYGLYVRRLTVVKNKSAEEES